MAGNNILVEIEEYAKGILKNEIPKKFVYHDDYHTERVVKAAEMIGRESGLSDDEVEMVTIAAWFHDTGYKQGCANHETTSCEIAKAYLESKSYPAEQIATIVGCIEATKMPQNPKSLIEQVLCDADLHHLACNDYQMMSEKMHKEVEMMKEETIDTETWNEMNFEFFKDHEFFTPYAKTKLQPIKDQNLASIKKAHKKAKKDKKYVEQLEAKILKLEGKVALKPDRGVETMFRTTSKNHLELSAMADNKANIMISVNTIILSVVVSVLIRKLYEYPNLVVPTIMLVVVCLAAIVLAILATRPNVSSGVFTDDDVLGRKTNLLFFGNFHKMRLDRYEWGMKEMMKDGEYLYGSMIKDIYFLGVVLGKKYKLLRLCYTTFMIGFVLSIVAFVVAMLMFPPQEQTGFYTF
ncbi:HD family phosphohydrolase [Roseivirga sp. 4D4]|uniref:Pycsar system effector family protein n=1 Tax=Roseivirga sp. 4D4 TaxID=1889784 RepID=UPI000853CB51|nr:Pycsar system effector family protein [Roseivirga sp. 4D4]OEK02978.1 HD family phosphohydrolase [Roseivirga sp. 4D4]